MKLANQCKYELRKILIDMLVNEGNGIDQVRTEKQSFSETKEALKLGLDIMHVALTESGLPADTGASREDPRIDTTISLVFVLWLTGALPSAAKRSMLAKPATVNWYASSDIRTNRSLLRVSKFETPRSFFSFSHAVMTSSNVSPTHIAVVRIGTITATKTSLKKPHTACLSGRFRNITTERTICMHRTKQRRAIEGKSRNLRVTGRLLIVSIASTVLFPLCAYLPP